MLEALVLRILTRYLAPYVHGMSKDKLSVGVWSGNVELEGLQIKPEVPELLGLPFKLLCGQIGKVKLNIPWQRLGAIPVCLEVDGIYVLVEPKPIPAQSDADLTEQLREAKMKQVLLREQELLEARLRRLHSEQGTASGGAASKDGDGGFFFRLSNKIISSIVVDIRNIHIALIDRQRGFKLGAVLAGVSVHNTDASWRKREASAAMPQQMQSQSVFYKACEISGFAIYCALEGAAEEGSSRAAASAGGDSKTESAAQEGSRSGSLSPTYEELVDPSLELALSGQTCPPQLRESDGESFSSSSPKLRRRLTGPSSRGAGASSFSSKEGAVAEEEAKSGWLPAHVREGKQTPTHFVLRPLHLRLTLSHRAASQELSARLEVLRESQGVEIGRSQLKALLDVSGEASARQRRCEALLLREAHTVMLGEEDLEGVTQQEFLTLYGQELQASAGIKGVAPLSPAQKKRLQVLHDVVGVRYLAKWRSICAEATQRMLAESQRLQLERAGQVIQRRSQNNAQQSGSPQGWWGWITGRGAQQQQSLQSPNNAADAAFEGELGEATWPLVGVEGREGAPSLDGDEEDAAAPLFTEADRRLIMAAVQNDEFLQSVGVPTKFSLDFELVRFTVSLLDDTQELEEEVFALARQRAVEEARKVTHISFDPNNPPPEETSPSEFPKPPPAPNATDSAAQVESRVATAFLSLELRNLCAALSLTNRQDASGRENNEWSFLTSLSSAAVRQAGHPLMHFRCEVEDDKDKDKDKDASWRVYQPQQQRASSGVLGEERNANALRERLALFGASPSFAGGSIFGGVNSSPFATSALAAPAASLKLSHRLTPKGNILGVHLRLAPLVASIRPEVVQTLCGFFEFETPEDVKRADSFANAETGGSRTAAELERMTQSEFVEGLRERGGTVYSAAVQRLPALLEVDVSVAAPILWLDTKNAGQIALHLGTLALRTEGPCPYSALRGVVELDQTRLLCYPCGLPEVSLLRPIPIRMHVEVLEAREFNVSVLLEEIFLELTPEALALLFAVPASIAKSLLDARSSARTTDALAPSPSRTETASFRLSPQTPDAENVAGAAAGNSASSSAKSAAFLSGEGKEGPRLGGEACETTNFSESRVSESGEEESGHAQNGGLVGVSPVAPLIAADGDSLSENAEQLFTAGPFASLGKAMLRCTCRFGRCGFMMRRPATEGGATQTAAAAVLLAQVADLFVDLSADVEKRLVQVDAELDYVSVTDPSTQSPLFVSLRSDPCFGAANLNGGNSATANANANVVPERSVSADFSPTLGGASPRPASSSASVGRAPSTLSGGEDEDFEDAMELPEKSVRVNFKGCLSSGHGPQGPEFETLANGEPAQLRATFLPVELHWRQGSFRQIIETLERYRVIVQAEFETDFAEFAQTSEAFASASAPAARLLLSQQTFQTFAVVKDTLASVQSSFAAYNNQEAVGSGGHQETTRASASSSSEGLVARLMEAEKEGREWLRRGLDLETEEPLPPLPSFLLGVSKPFLEVELQVKGAAVAFWKDDAVLARTGMQDLKAKTALFSNGDSETELTVGGGAVMIEERCVLAPRIAAEDDPASPSSGAGTAGATALLSLRIRQYGALSLDDRDTPTDSSDLRLPYSMCVTGRLNQVSLVYFQRDVSRVLDYLRDGIFDVVVSRSYQVVKQAASASYSLFALDVACPLFIVAEDKAVVPGFVAPPPKSAASSQAGARSFPRTKARMTNVGFSSSFFEGLSSPPPSKSPPASLGGAEDRTAAVASSAAREQVQLEGLGRYFLFDLGKLKVCNAFREASPPRGDDGGLERDVSLVRLESQEEPPESSKDPSPEGGDASLEFDLRVEMSGMRISASNNGELDLRPGDFVEGCVLENVEGILSVRSSPALLTVDVETSEWKLHLSRQQLTLLFDVLNENFAGEGYRPAASRFSEELFPIPTNASRVPNAQSPSPLVAETETAPSRGSSQTLRISSRFKMPRLELNASFGPKTPLAVLSVEGILVTAAVNVSTSQMSYRLCLCGDSFTIDDARLAGEHFFRRVAEGTPLADGSSRLGFRTSSTNDKKSSSGAFGEEEKMRQLESAVAADSLARPPGLKFEMRSSPRESGMAFAFCDVTIYGLLVELMEILNYFSTAWGFSTMRTFPKPPPAALLASERSISTEQASFPPPLRADTSASLKFFTPQSSATGFCGSVESVAAREEVDTAEEAAREEVGGERLSPTSPSALNEKPFTISVDVKNGRFLVYTDLRAATAPVILWRNDFLVRLSMLGSETYFDAIRVLNSRISRLEAATTACVPEASLSFARHSRSNSSSSWWREKLAADCQQQQPKPGAPSPRALSPVLDLHSAVLLCESFHAEGSGTYSSVENSDEQSTDKDAANALALPAQGGAGVSASSESASASASASSGSGRGTTASPQLGIRTPAAVSEMQRAFLAAPRVASAVRPSAATSALFTHVADMASKTARMTGDKSASAAEAPGSAQGSQRGGTGQAAPEGRGNAAVAAEGGLASSSQETAARDGGGASSSLEKRLVLSSLSLSFVVPEFSLRVSSRDMALLLAAARGLCSDGPSVSPPELPPQVRPPATSGGSSVEDKWRRRLCLPVEVRRTVSVHVSLEGVNLLLLDDLRASVLPLLQMELSVGGITTELTQKQMQVTVKNLASSLEYLNSKGGSWEPFIERLNVTAVYRRDFVEEEKQRRQKQLLLSGAADASPAEDPWRNFKAAQTFLLSSYSPFWLNCTPQLCSLLAWFLPYTLHHLQSNPSDRSGPSVSAAFPAAATPVSEQSSLSANCPPNASSLRHGDSSPEAADDPVALGGDTSSNSNAAFRYLNLSGSALYAFTLVKTREAGVEAGGETGDGGSGCCQSTGQLVLLQPSATPLSLDRLLQGRSAESSRRARPRQRLYIAQAPPLNALLRVSEIFPSVSLPAIARSLLATQDVDATAHAFLYREKVRQKMQRSTAAATGESVSNDGASEGSPSATKKEGEGGEGVVYSSFNPSPAEVGIFPRGMKAVAVNPLRRCCVGLLPPVRSSLYSRASLSTQQAAPSPASRERQHLTVASSSASSTGGSLGGAAFSAALSSTASSVRGGKGSFPEDPAFEAERLSPQGITSPSSSVSAFSVSKAAAFSSREVSLNTRTLGSPSGGSGAPRQRESSLFVAATPSSYREFLQSEGIENSPFVVRASSVSGSFAAPSPVRHVENASQVVCDVLSPHPSFKLLVVSSTVRLENCSGLPLEVCFLDSALSPLLVPAAQVCCAPLAALGEQRRSAKPSFEDFCCRHPDLLKVPPWLLAREERWKRQREAEAEEQRALLRLMQDEATGGLGAQGEDRRAEQFCVSEAKKTLVRGGASSQELLQDRLAFSFLLPDRHVMSVPPSAILASGWVNLVFRPAAFAQPFAAEENAPQKTRDETSGAEGGAASLPSPPDMSALAGWVSLVDTRSRMEGLRWRQSSFLPPHERPGSSGADAAFSTVTGERNLFFLVNVEGRKSALPAEKEIKQVTIYPALTLVNATATEIDVLLTPRTSDPRGPSRPSPPSALANSSPLQRLQALQQKPVLQATLRRHSTFFVYEVPPNRQLSMRLRFSLLDGAEWSDEMRDFLYADDEVVCRVLLPSRVYSPVELEVLHDAAEVSPFLPFVAPQQLVAVISAPRVFVDRTGLGVRPLAEGRRFPEFDGYCLLGSSSAQEVSLVLAPRGSRGGPPPLERRVDIPAMGGFSHAALTTPERFYTLCLKTEKILLSETAGAVSRVVSLLPEFILTNALKMPIFFRQYGTQGPTFEVLPGQSHPVYWVNADLPLAIQFRPGTSEGFAWSGAVVASEETAGKSWMAVFNGVRDAAPGVFCVEVSPDRGVKSVCIRSAEVGGGFLLINKCPIIQRVMVHTFHTEMSQQNALSRQQDGGASRRPAMKLPDFDFHFFARDGETVAFGWQFPFTYSSRPCHVLLWLDGKTVAPKRPIVLDMETPQYKRYEVNLGLKDMPQIVVRTEKRGDAMVVEVRPKPGTGSCLVERPLSLSHSPSSDCQNGLVGDVALRSLHVAVTMSQVGVSLVYDKVREELCFAELSQLAIGFQERGERQKFLLRIADIQVDNQMENARKPVLLANRGGGSQAGADEDGASGTAASKPFLHLYVVRHHTASSDLVLRRVQVEVDNLELDIDADMLNGLNDFLWACMESLGLSAASRRGVSEAEVASWIAAPLHFNYSPPPLPTVLCLESVFIDRFDVYCWCSFVLDKMHMLSDLIKVGLRILMASGRLELMGAKLNFQCEEFRNLRGTAKTFVACLQDRYSYHILNSVLSSLGQTSLLNLPRLPYEFGKNTIGLAANAVDSVSAGLGSLLSTFTFDSEYINRRQRERVRSTHSMRDGFLSAGKNIGEGVWSLTNIVTKPIEGAQREGVGGFFKGIGKGLVGSLVKPLDKVGQAVSDVTRGIKAEVSKPVGASKFRNERRRKPRMMWGEVGEIRVVGVAIFSAYDEAEAALRESLGLSVTRRLQKCVSVLKQDGLPPRHLAVLFYPKDIFFVDLFGTYLADAVLSGGTTDSAGGPSKPRVRILWHVCIPLIRDVRASTHGVLIRAAAPTQGGPEEALAAASCQQNGASGFAPDLETQPSSTPSGRVRGRRFSNTTLGGFRTSVCGDARLEQSYQIPCSSAESVMQIYRELLDAQQGSTAVVELGSWDSFRISQDDEDE